MTELNIITLFLSIASIVYSTMAFFSYRRTIKIISKIEQLLAEIEDQYK
jgi:hypothetical protein